MFIEIIYWSNW